jgi:hypothetical protein
VHVLVVWEPILATDWRAPSGSTLARIPDQRVRQFWDPKHLVAEELARVASGKPAESKPNCCIKKGFYWDEVALYAPHSKWKQEPVPSYWNGPVWRIGAALEQAFNVQQ